MSAIDEASGSMVALMSTAPTYDEDADHQQYIDDCLRLVKEAGPEAKSDIVVLCVDGDYPRPSARWRKKIAELRDSMAIAQAYFALVTTSALTRGALTAINWLTRPAPRFHTAAFATFEEAQRWLESEHERPLPVIRKLHEQCLARTSRSPRGALDAR